MLFVGLGVVGNIPGALIYALKPARTTGPRTERIRE
jgi:hypothetical protein